jgi:hypothetical protein
MQSVVLLIPVGVVSLSATFFGTHKKVSKLHPSTPVPSEDGAFLFVICPVHPLKVLYCYARAALRDQGLFHGERMLLAEEK